MKESLFIELENIYKNSILEMNNFFQNPLELTMSILDIIIVVFLIYKLIKFAKDSRGWQLFKGIILLLIATWVSGIIHLNILHAILKQIVSWGVLALIIIFQPEIRRALESLGTNKLKKFIGFTENFENKTKENIYRIVIAAEEMSKAQIGALIVIERDIPLKDISETGISMGSEISPQLLTNIFVPKTPLHDGAVIISNNKIEAAACMLPLANDQNIDQRLGTRHRAAIGISKETDAVVVVVSEETGKISVAENGNLQEDLSEEALKKILIREIIEKRLSNKEKRARNIFEKYKK